MMLLLLLLLLSSPLMVPGSFTTQSDFFTWYVVCPSEQLGWLSRAMAPWTNCLCIEMDFFFVLISCSYSFLVFVLLGDSFLICMFSFKYTKRTYINFQNIHTVRKYFFSNWSVVVQIEAWFKKKLGWIFEKDIQWTRHQYAWFRMPLGVSHSQT